MSRVIQGLGAGGLTALLWAAAIAVTSGGAVLPGALLTLIPACLVGGVLGARLPSDALARLPLGAVIGCMLGLGAVWGVGYLAFAFLLTHSFDLRTEIAALFATVVLGSAVVGGLATALLTAWMPRHAGRAGALLPLALALLTALMATRVTAFIVGFQLASWLLAIATSALVTVGLRIGVPSVLAPVARSRALAGISVVALALGLLGYSTSDSARHASWQDSQLVRSLASALAGALDVDGDGVAGGGGDTDCDDSDPEVFPGNADTPGDGRDGDCSGADSDPTAVRALWTSESGARRRGAAAHPFPRKQYNLLLITLDAVRADHLSLYGYERATSPNLAMLGRTALVFDAAWAASNYTASSLFSLFTGLYPSAFLAGTQVTSVRGLTLTEQLAAAGWQTEAIVDLHPMLEHVAAGFDRVDGTLGVRGAKAVRNRSTGSTARELTTLATSALDRLSGSEAPFFLWTHYSEPHAGYLPHEGYDFGDAEIDLYDGEIAYADASVGTLIAHLQQTGRLQDTIIVVTSDHGEAFGEHGVFTHGQSLFEEELHVPLVLYLPSSAGTGFDSGRVPAPVDLTDVVPTLLDAVGLQPRTPVHGESLLGHALADAPLRTPETFAEVRLPYARQQALRLGGDKIIADHLVGVVRRYDLAADPLETSPTVGNAADLEALQAWTNLHLAFPRIGPAR